MDELRQIASEAIESKKNCLNGLSQSIWHLKELAFQEKQSHAVLCEFFENENFDVHRSFAGLETAFLARWETRDSDDSTSYKPHICVICEYDALPDIGHACGHNLIAEIGVAAALGIKAALDKGGNVKGKLSVIGTPAEEGGGGKIELLKADAFKNVDIALMAHPAPFSDARPIFLSTKRFVASFHGKASHAAGFPWEGVNALDAAVQAYVSIGTLRQQLKPDWRIGVIITKGGTKTNIIPSEAEIQCQFRTTKESEILELETKVKRSVLAAAEATGCRVDIADGPNPYKCLVTNETLAKLYESSLTYVGVQVLNLKSKTILGSTDMGNVSHQIPSLHPTYNCHTTAFNHTLEFAEAAASAEAQPPTLTQGKVLAMTALEVFYNPSLLNEIRLDFESDMSRI